MNILIYACCTLMDAVARPLLSLPWLALPARSAKHWRHFLHHGASQLGPSAHTGRQAIHLVNGRTRGAAWALHRKD